MNKDIEEVVTKLCLLSCAISSMSLAESIKESIENGDSLEGINSGLSVFIVKSRENYYKLSSETACLIHSKDVDIFNILRDVISSFLKNE